MDHKCTRFYQSLACCIDFPVDGCLVCKLSWYVLQVYITCRHLSPRQNTKSVIGLHTVKTLIFAKKEAILITSVLDSSMFHEMVTKRLISSCPSHWYRNSSLLSYWNIRRNNQQLSLEWIRSYLFLTGWRRHMKFEWWLDNITEFSWKTAYIIG